MKNLPTAKVFLQNLIEENNYDSNIDIEEALIEFAKLHVKDTLSAVIKNARLDVNGVKCLCKGFKNFEGNWITASIDKHSISNAYPLSKIK